jgi:hypothetical protein
MTEVRIEVPDEEQYDWIVEVKEKHGLTWRGMLVLAAKELERDG